jgi:hypothetical protein
VQEKERKGERKISDDRFLSSSTGRNQSTSPVVRRLETWEQRQTVPIERCARQVRVVTAAVVRYGGRQSCYRIFGGALPTCLFLSIFSLFDLELLESGTRVIPGYKTRELLGDDTKLIGSLARHRLMVS